MDIPTSIENILNAYSKANNKDATKTFDHPTIANQLGRLLGLTTATQLVWLTWFTIPTFPCTSTVLQSEDLQKNCVPYIISNILQFRDNMSASMSGLYGIFLSVLGVALPLTESFAGKPNPYMFEVLASCSFSYKCYIVSLIKKLLFCDILFVTPFSDFTFFKNILFPRHP